MQFWRNWLCALVAIGGIALAGCPSPEPPAAATEKTDRPPVPRTSVTLRLAVVNDQPLAGAIGRLRGEWAERSGGSLTVAEATLADVVDDSATPIDLLVFPSRYLGELCESNRLRPVRDNVIENQALRFQDLFPLVRQRLISFDKQVMALPLGVDLPVRCYRELGDNNAIPPATWEAYLRTFARLSRETDQNPNDGAWEPVRSWGAVLLLARVAAYANTEASVFFDPETMRPLIAGEPFVRALTELRSVTRSMPPDNEPASESDRRRHDPHAAAIQVANGRASTAIGLPPSERFHEEEGQPDAAARFSLHWAALPGASEVYDPIASAWIRRDVARQTPILGIGDRLASVTTASRNAASAFQLLAWLASAEVSTQLARAGEGTLPVRESRVDSPQWYDTPMTAGERAELASVLNRALAGERCLIVPRIPGVDEYLAMLAEAVEDACFEDAEPAAALEKAAANWELVTVRRGRESQRQAYLRHLGIATP